MFWENLIFNFDATWLAIAGGSATAVCAFGLLAALGLRYDPAWAGPPHDAPAVAGERAALLTGGVCVGVAAMGGLILAPVGVPPQALLIGLGQAALMAAAAVCDWRKWQLPLPFSLAGIGLGLAGLSLAGSPLGWALAAVTVTAALAINALATAGTWQGGDVLATIWIGLALPVSGLLAFALGQAALGVARIARRWPRGTRAPVGGAWLMAAVLILGLPPVEALAALAFDPPAARPAASRPLVGSAEPNPETAGWLSAAQRAGDATAWVAFGVDRAERESRAGRAASLTRGMATTEGAPPAIASALISLASALDAYDLDAIRGASARLADLRAELGADIPHSKEP